MVELVLDDRVDEVVGERGLKPSNYLSPSRLQGLKPAHYMSPSQLQGLKPANYVSPSQLQGLQPAHYISPSQLQGLKPAHYVSPSAIAAGNRPETFSRGASTGSPSLRQEVQRHIAQHFRADSASNSNPSMPNMQPMMPCGGPLVHINHYQQGPPPMHNQQSWNNMQFPQGPNHM